jgi:hypothetical protein
MRPEGEDDEHDVSDDDPRVEIHEPPPISLRMTGRIRRRPACLGEE